MPFFKFTLSFCPFCSLFRTKFNLFFSFFILTPTVFLTLTSAAFHCGSYFGNLRGRFGRLESDNQTGLRFLFVMFQICVSIFFQTIVHCCGIMFFPSQQVNDNGICFRAVGQSVAGFPHEILGILQIQFQFEDNV